MNLSLPRNIYKIIWTENLLSNHHLKNQMNSIKNTWNFKTKILVHQHSAVTTKFKTDKIVSATNQMILLLDGNNWWIIMRITEIMEICRSRWMEAVLIKRIKMLDSLVTLATRKLQQMNIQVSYIELILTWMILMSKMENRFSQQALEILVIWFLKRNIFNSNFKTRIWNANKWIFPHFIMMKYKMTLKRIKNKVFLINPILVIYHWDYHSAKLTQNLFL